MSRRRRLRRLPTDDPAPPPLPFGMSILGWRLTRIALTAVVLIVVWGFASSSGEAPIVGTYVDTIRVAPYRDLRIRLTLEEDRRFAFGWIREYDGAEEERGETRGTWQAIEDSIQLTATWDDGPLPSLRSFLLPGDRHVLLAGPGIPPLPPGGSSWAVRQLRRERP